MLVLLDLLETTLKNTPKMTLVTRRKTMI